MKMTFCGFMFLDVFLKKKKNDQAESKNTSVPQNIW